MEKKKSNHTTTSIDEKHNDMMGMYYVIENETIPKLNDEIQELINQAKAIRTKKNEQYYELLDEIKAKKQELKRLKSSKKEYLLQNSKYIFHYYEEKQKINLGENVKDKKTMHTFSKSRAIRMKVAILITSVTINRNDYFNNIGKTLDKIPFIYRNMYWIPRLVYCATKVN